jgi:hypothetical protein
MRGEEIDFSDIPEQGKAFFKNAVLPLPERKATVTIRLDHDVSIGSRHRGVATRPALTHCSGPMEAHKA